jgi:dipeptidase D
MASKEAALEKPLDALDALEPALLWHHFRELSRIPRGTRNEAAAAAWVAEQGRRLGCAVAQDAAGNVLIRKPAAPGREHAPVTALQAHVDMVCEQNEGTGHDFLADPIELVRDGDLVRARGTTLGADDGIGVAAALAVLGSGELRHGPLEVLVTVGEEMGLTGAAALRPGTLEAAYLLNLDSGKESHLTIGCSGGLDSVATRQVGLRPASPGRVFRRLKVSGLKGGHSAGAIDLGRGNAVQLLARALWTLVPAFDLELASLGGGDKRNAIPREAFALLCLEPGREGELRAALAELEADLRAELGGFDPGLALVLEAAAAAGQAVMEPREARTVVGFLYALMHGVIAQSPLMPGLVQTSTNLAAVATRSGVVEVAMLHRSSVASAKAAVADRVAALCELAGFEVRHSGAYPGWRPEPEAPLVRLVTDAHLALFGRPMQLRASHGGLECGPIGAAHPGLQMVSFGPDMWDIHSPDERVSISSVASFWTLLGAVLEAV